MANAALEITARIPNAHRLEQSLRQWPQIARREILRAMWEAQLLFEAVAKENTPVGVTGILRGSIAAQRPVASHNDVLGVVGTPALHAVPVELGTKPHFPPPEALEDWVRAKLDVAPERVPFVALQIARKIAARGTLAVGMFHRAEASTRTQRERIFANAHARIVKKAAAI